MSRHLGIPNWHGWYCAYLYVPVVFQCRRVSCKSWSFSSVGDNCQSFSSGIPVWGSFHPFFPLVFQCTLQVFAGFPNGVPVYTGSTSGIPVYTAPASVHWLRSRVERYFPMFMPSPCFHQSYVRYTASFYGINCTSPSLLITDGTVWLLTFTYIIVLLWLIFSNSQWFD